MLKPLLALSALCLCFGLSNAQNVNLGTGSGNSGSNNVSVGTSAGDIVTGSNNVFLGHQSGILSTSGSQNTFLGSRAGNGNFGGLTGSNNVMTGYMSGLFNSSGSSNTFLGTQAGYYNTTGSGNVFIGYQAGYQGNVDNKLKIDNANSSVPLIAGDFSTRQVGINANPAATYTLNVGGTINATGILVNGSPIAGGGSQWTTTGTNIYYGGTGNVGVGKIPTYKFDVDGAVNATAIYINGAPLGATPSPWSNVGANINYTGTGNVGIGASNPDFRLTVNGKIKAEEVQVVVDVPADYVFERDYKLMPLYDVKKFVESQKHLPGVPSAEEITKNGWSIGDMSNKLLEKIEELTLHMIRLEEENEQLKLRLKKLENQ